MLTLSGDCSWAPMTDKRQRELKRPAQKWSKEKKFYEQQNYPSLVPHRFASHMCSIFPVKAISSNLS